MVTKLPHEDIASPYRCTPKCMSFSTLLACRRRLKSSFKARIDGNCGMKHETQIQQKQGGVFHGPRGVDQKVPKLLSPKRKYGQRSPSKKNTASIERKCGAGDEASCYGAVEPGAGWDLRRRDSKVNGADIYVARVTKNGLGSAKPCWRCLHWCYWAGVKRIFHWDEASGGWEVVKVNSPRTDWYETTADIRLQTRTASHSIT